jgi:hypothetical protein
VRKLVLALAIAASMGAVGCKHPGSARLEGRWKGLRADGVAANVQDAANAFALQTEIVVKGDKITITAPNTKAQQDTYFVDSENKTTLVVHTEKDGLANKETFQFTEDGKQMTWRLNEGRTITFQKLKD